MKVLAFVDLHGSLEGLRTLKEKARKADIIVCAGDITIFEQDIKHILQRINHLGKKVLMIPGNHETETVLKRLCEQHKNIEFIHGRVYEYEDVAFFGYGTGGFSTEDKGFEEAAKKLEKNWHGKKLVLVTHAPPYKTSLDDISGSSCGNKTIRRFIKKNHPIAAISGHLHENSGKHDVIGMTKVVNPGLFGKFITV